MAQIFYEHSRQVLDNETGAIVQEKHYDPAVSPDAIEGMVRPSAYPLACTPTVR